MENQKIDKASLRKPDFGSGSQLCVGKVLAPTTPVLRWYI